MPSGKQFVIEQIARAQHFAHAVNSSTDRERFEKMARDYRSELQAAEAAEGLSARTPIEGRGRAG
ncbi:hypothetical protein ACTGJ9_017180 [Bradyrhizobium sp. RDM12]